LTKDLKLTGNKFSVHLGKISESQTVERAIENVNRGLLERNKGEVGARGNSKTKSLILADIKRAYDFVNANKN
jgi:hypothetical protein